jgi:hypothetical protein
METFTQLFGDLLAFVYHCFDRLVIYGYDVGVIGVSDARRDAGSSSICVGEAGAA